MRVFELRYRCPDLHNQEDAEILRETLGSSPGIGMVEVDLSTRTVRVETANSDGGVDVYQRLINAGYPPEDAATST